MKKPKKTSLSSSAAKSLLSTRAVVLVAVLLTIGGVTAIAKYESRRSDPKAEARQGAVANQPGNNNVTVEVGGKKLQLNAQTLQQGPLTQEQAQQIAEALKDNQSTDGLVQVHGPGGSVSLDLEGRFQNVTLAKKNEDGSVSQACVDNSKAASAFLQPGDSTKQSGSGSGRRAPVKE